MSKKIKKILEKHSKNKKMNFEQDDFLEEDFEEDDEHM